MKAIYKRLGLAATIGYFFGILLVAYFLISIPEDFKNLTTGLSTNILSQLEPLFTKLNISIAVVLGLGMISLLLLLFNDQQNVGNNQFFIAGAKKDKKSSNQQEANSPEEINEAALSKIESIISQETDLVNLARQVLSAVCKDFEASQGAIYKAEKDDGKRIIELIASFAYPIADSQKITFEFGEGLAGQAAKEGKILNIDNVPEGYIQILSGLGSSSPTNLLILPLIHNETVHGVAEIASFKKFTKRDSEIISKALSLLAPKFLPQTDATPSKKKSTIAQ